MTFVHPERLLLLVLPLVLGFWSVRRQAAGLTMPFDHQVHATRLWLGVLLRGVESVSYTHLTLPTILLV